MSFLANNDLNATASCLHVKLMTDGQLTMDLHVHAQLWKLLFSLAKEECIEPVNTLHIDNPANTCVHAAFKAHR